MSSSNSSIFGISEKTTREILLPALKNQVATLESKRQTFTQRGVKLSEEQFEVNTRLKQIDIALKKLYEEQTALQKRQTDNTEQRSFVDREIKDLTDQINQQNSEIQTLTNSFSRKSTDAMDVDSSVVATSPDSMVLETNLSAPPGMKRKAPEPSSTPSQRAPSGFASKAQNTSNEMDTTCIEMPNGPPPSTDLKSPRGSSRKKQKTSDDMDTTSIEMPNGPSQSSEANRSSAEKAALAVLMSFAKVSPSASSKQVGDPRSRALQASYPPGTEVFYKKRRGTVVGFDAKSNVFDVKLGETVKKIPESKLLYLPRVGEKLLFKDMDDEEKRYYHATVLKHFLTSSEDPNFKIQIQWDQYGKEEVVEYRTLDAILRKNRINLSDLKQDQVEDTETKEFGIGYYF